MIDWELITILSLSNYIISWFLVDAHVLDAPRHAFKRDTPFLRFGGIHMFECRTCVSFWLAFGACLPGLNFTYLFPVWAISRILRMQEREVYD